MNATAIEWTDWSCTPLKMRMPDGALVNACAKVSQGCQNCYAESYVRRFWREAWGPFPGYTPALLRIGAPALDEKELQAVLRLGARVAAGKADPAKNRVFWNDMTDEFLEFWPDEFRDRLFAVRALTPNLVHQVLTKRAERMADYVLGADGREIRFDIPGLVLEREPFDWPLPNVWLGVSVEDQQRADERIPHLMRTPAAVRFLSCEPLLGPVDLAPYLSVPEVDVIEWGQGPTLGYDHPIDWVIAGGESGPRARPCDVGWVRSLVRQCAAAVVACFVKQLGADVRCEPSEVWPANTKWYVGGVNRVGQRDSKGGDPEEWPADLRVREFPRA